jgi:hypothetical protein
MMERGWERNGCVRVWGSWVNWDEIYEMIPLRDTSKQDKLLRIFIWFDLVDGYLSSLLCYTWYISLSHTLMVLCRIHSIFRLSLIRTWLINDHSRGLSFCHGSVGCL